MIQSFITARKRSLRRLCFHRCLFVHGAGSLSGGRGHLCPGGLYPGGLYPGGLCLGRGHLCPGGVCPRGVSVQGRGYLCPGEGVSLSRGGGSLTRGVSMGEGAYLCRGFSVQGVSVQGTSLSGRPPRTVTCGRYASYWNAFLFSLEIDLMRRSRIFC